MKRIAIIGCGNMGEVLLKGILEKGLVSRNLITVADKKSSRLSYIKKTYGVSVNSSAAEAVSKSDIVVLAVKPQDMKAVLKELNSAVEYKLIISIAAGITLEYIKAKTGTKRLIRAMPNTPALAGHGITAISYAKGVSTYDINIADRIFGSVGKVVHIDEKSMDTVTAVSGSGPAYFFLLMEAMVEAAISLGMEKETAEKLVNETAFGAASLQNKTRQQPSTLREKVTSKGGTTEAALNVFKNKGFKRIVKDAVRAACKKSKTLSR
jgi:pyrroline-5-carboxylate reductase